jgi:arsenate reductase
MQDAASKPAFGPAYTKNVMFLCNHNSCRSQMAEGWVRTLRGAGVGVASAGIVEGTAIKPGAVTVMLEAGVDIGPNG